MHELPKDLNKSLRSWRGSVVRDHDHDDEVDIEKADQEGFLNESQEPQLRGTTSSLVLHPIRSSQALHKRLEADIHRQQWDRPDQTSRSQETNNTINNASNNQVYSLPAGQSRATFSAGPSPVETRRQATFQTTASKDKKSIFDQPKVADPDNAAGRFVNDPTPLTSAEFYELMGMNPPPKGQMVDPDFPNYPKKFAVPGGLYAKIKESYDNLSYRHRAFDVLTYFLMILQLLLSAVFIILGSLNNVDSHLPIAVLGALSTVVAGSLALMKGQGLPNRLRQGCDGLHYVLFEAQELYWDVGAGRKLQFKDIKKLREDYLRVMEEQRVNHPDTWNSYSSGIASGVKQNRSGIPFSKSVVSVGK